MVLRLRSRTKVGATFIDVLARYAEQVRAAGGRLYLVGVDQHVAEQLRRTGRVDVEDAVKIYSATSIIGESSHQAVEDATAWLASEHGGRKPGGAHA